MLLYAVCCTDLMFFMADILLPKAFDFVCGDILMSLQRPLMLFQRSKLFPPYLSVLCLPVHSTASKFTSAAILFFGLMVLKKMVVIF